jgi:DNA-binding MarR family transcriptional regulator
MAQLSTQLSKEILRLWLRLLSSTSLIERELKRLLREHFDITLAQFDLMAELYRYDEPKTMSEISEMLMVSNGNVTGVVDRLSRDGLVDRLPFETDRRVYLLALTSKGQRLFKEMAAKHESWLSEIFAEVDGQTIIELSKTLKDTREKLRIRELA